MIILKDWEWKYRIFFNNNVLDKVNQFNEQFNKEEQRLFQKQIKFYRSFYTIENLLQALNDPSLNKDDVIKKLLKISKNVIVHCLC
ncbi:MAG: hypothetical protein SO253_00970 [Bacilli bacterium]|nr:hypothetical protein [Bacilli bacterium]